MHADDQWITDTYDEIVGSAGEDGSTSKETREKFASAYEESVRSGELERPELDLYDEGLSLFDRFVKPKRRSRARKLQDDIESITAALQGETILGEDDPVLAQAFPLGDLDGRDKTLGLWTAEDWRNAKITRYRKAAEATASASIFDEQSGIIEAALIARGVRITRDLFISPGGAAA